MGEREMQEDVCMKDTVTRCEMQEAMQDAQIIRAATIQATR
jgi:hypothetical protein